jgi:hypothetical protein
MSQDLLLLPEVVIEQDDKTTQEHLNPFFMMV